jgi:hypothetical protein
VHSLWKRRGHVEHFTRGSRASTGSRQNSLYSTVHQISFEPHRCLVGRSAPDVQIPAPSQKHAPGISVVSFGPYLHYVLHSLGHVKCVSESSPPSRQPQQGGSRGNRRKHVRSVRCLQTQYVTLCQSQYNVVTQSLWVAGMIKFIENRRQRRLGGHCSMTSSRARIFLRTAPISGDAPFFSDIW